MNSFLIVRLGSLGDIVHTIPAVAALRARHPTARLDWVTHPTYIELLNLVVGLDRSIPLDTRTPGSLWRGLRALRRAQYDVVIDFQGLVKSAVIAQLSGATRRIGFSHRDLREPLARFFYTEMLETKEISHVIQKNLALLGALNITETLVQFPLNVSQVPIVSQVQQKTPDGFVVINPGAAWPNKRWEPEHFGALASSIRSTYGWPSVVLWGPGEQALAAAVVASSDGAASISPTTTIPELLALAQVCKLFISGDTGPLHLAASVGAPIVALFGPTRPERNGPFAGSDVVVSRVDQCSCVYERRCRLKHPCINDITVPEVVAAVDRCVQAHS